MNPALATRICTVLPTLQGWASEAKALAMAELITNTRPHVVVEIGVFGGKSLIPQAMALVDSGSGVIYGIDPWRVSTAVEGEQEAANVKWWGETDLDAIHKGCMAVLWREQLTRVAVVIRNSSCEVVQLFPSIDILHIDGCHSELASCRDVDLFYPQVTHGGYIWFDDTDWGSTQRALGILRDKCKEVSRVGTCALFQKP